MFERFRGGELFFIAQFLDKRDLHFLAVNVSGEVKQVSFHSKLWRFAGEGGAAADIKRGAVGFAPYSGMDGIDSRWGKDEPSSVNVRSRESELAAKLIPSPDQAGQRIAAPQHLACEVKLAIADGFTDASAAHDLAIQGDGGQAVDHKIKFSAQYLEHSHVAAPFVAKSEGASDTNAVDALVVTGEVADELFAGLLAERVIEMDEQSGVHAEGSNGAQLLRQGINEGWNPILGHDGVGMAVESDDDRHGLLLLRICDHLANDLLMAEMHAIKDADGDTDLPCAARQVQGVVNKGHAA